MALDGFIELIRKGKPVGGETLDKTFRNKKAMSINSFQMWTSSNESGLDDDDIATTPTPGTTQTTRSSTKPLQGKDRKKCPVSFKITKDIDLGSTELFQSYCQTADAQVSVPFDTVRITLRKANGANPLVFLVIEFTQVRVTAYSVSAQGDKLPVESVTFNCRTAQLQYRPQKFGTGIASATILGWDFDAETAIEG